MYVFRKQTFFQSSYQYVFSSDDNFVPEVRMCYKNKPNFCGVEFYFIIITLLFNYCIYFNIFSIVSKYIFKINFLTR